MDRKSNVRRITISSAAHNPSTEPEAIRSLQRRKVKGQALVLVALCMLLLIAIVGLATDGGSMLGQRREAQNGTDGAALAGTRVMLTHYRDMIYNNPDYDVDYDHSTELLIKQAIDEYAARNGVMTNTLTAFFVNDDRQIVSVSVGVDRGRGQCGINQQAGPCRVGENGRVPWTLGAKGIDVRGTAQTDSFFMSLFGWNKVSGAANSTAFMGVGSMIDNISLVPIGLFTTTFDFGTVIEGRHYQLIDATTDNGSGNWGWVDFNGSGVSATTVRAWLVCGFNPSATQTQWENTWCPRYSNAPGWGPTQHYQPISTANWLPQPDPTYIHSLVFGEQHYGWWLRGSSGAVNSNCSDFKGRVDDAGTEGVEILFPIFDRVIPGGGTDSMYHVRIVVAFRLMNCRNCDPRPPPYYGGDREDVSCRPQPAPTATIGPSPTPCTIGPCPTATPSSGGGSRIKWHIEGDAIKIFSASSSGRHGDIRRTSVPVIFLER
jgi:hypothetical protein